MVDLKDVGDYVVLILVAAGAGGLGGFAAALVPTTSPGVTNPRWLTGPVVGAAAAVAILIVFPGTEETTKGVGAAAVTTTTWSLIQVVPVSVVVGWAGPKALGALQDRLLAAAKEERLQATATVAKSQLETMAASAGAAINQHAETEVATLLAPQVQTSLESNLEGAKAAIDAAVAGTAS